MTVDQRRSCSPRAAEPHPGERVPRQRTQDQLGDDRDRGDEPELLNQLRVASG